jgi:hypothetical protein
VILLMLNLLIVLCVMVAEKATGKGIHIDLFPLFILETCEFLIEMVFLIGYVMIWCGSHI